MPEDFTDCEIKKEYNYFVIVNIAKRDMYLTRHMFEKLKYAAKSRQKIRDSCRHTRPEDPQKKEPCRRPLILGGYLRNFCRA